MTQPVDPACCPLCGAPNRCVMASGEPAPGPCWCASVEIPASVLARVPADARGVACVCASCARSAEEES